MDNWKTIRLGDACFINSNSYSPRENWRFINYLDTGNITDNRVDTIQYIDTESEKIPSRARRKVKKNSIVYSTVRPNQRHFGILKSLPDNFLVSTGFAVIDVNAEILNADFLYYLLTQPVIVEKLHAIAEQSTSAYPSIKSSDIKNLIIVVPEIIIQEKIASILSTIDDKIKLNTGINENLEQQAQAIFKAWFVDFLPFGGIMPKNWRMGKLKEILSLNKNSIKAGTDIELPYLPIEKIPMNTFAVKEFCPNSEAKSSLITFSENDIIIGAMRVYFHRVIIAPCSGITRTTCFVLVPYDKNYLAYSLLLCNQNKSIDFAQRTSKGSTMPYAIWEGGLGDMDIIIPDYETITKFNNIIMPMLEKIKYSYFENQHLSALRDALLPKLMNGEIDVSAVKI